MPWEKTTPLDERKLFIESFLTRLYSVSELCEKFGISRTTGHKWIKRHAEEGPEGLQERSRRPHSSPFRVEREVEEILLETKRRHLMWGPRKIIPYLKRRGQLEEAPAPSTVSALFKRHELVRPRRRRLKHPHPGAPTIVAEAPNDLWATDFKGDFNTRDGVRVWPLTITDQCSRRLLACKGLPSTKGGPVREVFDRVFREFGLPAAIRTDNGTPFSSRAVSGLSLLNVWWMRLGIRHERTRPGCPQENGKHERMHRTLKQAVCLSPRANLQAQQRAFNDFIEEYNDERPHEALDNDTPSSRYERSTRIYTGELPPQEYPGHFEVKNVTRAGEFRLGNRCVFVSHALSDNLVGLEEVEDGIWDIYLNEFLITRINERDYKPNQ